jgi:hypothetical protein
VILPIAVRGRGFESKFVKAVASQEQVRDGSRRHLLHKTAQHVQSVEGATDHAASWSARALMTYGLHAS